MRHLILAAFAALFPSVTLAQPFMYVSVGGENKIVRYRMNGATGALIDPDETPVTAGPGAMCFDHRRSLLYVALRSEGAVGVFHTRNKDEKLSHVDTAALGTNAAFVSIDRSGKYLLTADYGAGKIGVHPLRNDGSIDAAAGHFVSTAKNAHSILTDPSNRFLFVPHTGPNAIFQFTFDDKTGQIAPNTPPKVTTPPKTEPRHLAIHPLKNIVYVDNEAGSSVTAYHLDGEKGTLEPFQTVPTIPADFKEGNTCAEIAVHPSGKFVYASNRGHDSIACFRVDDSNGALTSLGQAPTEKTPRSFAIEPRGRFLFSAGQGTDKLAAYRIDGEQGTLERIATYTVGQGPAWVQWEQQMKLD